MSFFSPASFETTDAMLSDILDPEIKTQDAKKVSFDQDDVIIEDISEEEENELIREIEHVAAPEKRKEKIPEAYQKKSHKTKVDEEESEEKEEDDDTNFIYANGSIFAEEIELNKLKQLNIETIKYFSQLKDIIGNVYDEFKGTATHSKNKSTTKSGGTKTFDKNKKLAVNQLCKDIDDKLKKMSSSIQTIGSKNFKMLEDSQRKYYLEPRFTQAGSGGAGRKNSLNNPPVSASVFYTPEECMTYTDPSIGSTSGLISSSIESEIPSVKSQNMDTSKH